MLDTYHRRYIDGVITFEKNLKAVDQLNQYYLHANQDPAFHWFEFDSRYILTVETVHNYVVR